ncbi:MAG: hypothetical protein LBU39_01765 [Desulfobulbaceae bacterium]|jgi:hypothetical protein|nr:hypothetical protein [Desulfobulbaceae bacterium]
MTSQKNQSKSDQLRRFYQCFSGKGALPLAPDDLYYVRRLEETAEKDPIRALSDRIEWAESESVHLLTGFRGNGKSTELLRLKKLLEKSGCVVFLVDMLKYVLMTKPIAISDFTLSLMAALSDAVEESADCHLKPLREGYGARLMNFLTGKIELGETTIKSPVADIGLKLQTDTTFKEKIQQSLAGHTTQLVADAHKFVDDLVTAIRREKGKADLKVVLLVDSMEQLRGVGESAQQLYDSVVELFSGQAANLDYPKLHVVYTVPPFLPILSKNLGRALDGHPISQWPNIHVRGRDGQGDEAGLGIMKRLVAQRFSDWEEIVPEDFLNQLAIWSGGDMRDFFRLLREFALIVRTLREKNPEAAPGEDVVSRVVQQLRNELLPIAKDDARWLAEIHTTKQASLANTKALPDLARFFDSNLIMNYQNGEPWFDIHPVIEEEVKRMSTETD